MPPKYLRPRHPRPKKYPHSNKASTGLRPISLRRSWTSTSSNVGSRQHIRLHEQDARLLHSQLRRTSHTFARPASHRICPLHPPGYPVVRGTHCSPVLLPGGFQTSSYLRSPHFPGDTHPVRCLWVLLPLAGCMKTVRCMRSRRARFRCSRCRFGNCCLVLLLALRRTGCSVRNRWFAQCHPLRRIRLCCFPLLRTGCFVRNHCFAQCRRFRRNSQTGFHCPSLLRIGLNIRCPRLFSFHSPPVHSPRVQARLACIFALHRTLVARCRLRQGIGLAIDLSGGFYCRCLDPTYIRPAEHCPQTHYSHPVVSRRQCYAPPLHLGSL
jgi:hypothetical protein